MYKFGFRQMLLVVVAASVMPFVVNFAEPGVQFSQDSWAYYDLAQTTFVDFYRSFVHRSYGEGLGYNQSFPPLWPVVVAVGLVVAPFGVTTQILLAVISAIATIIPLRSIARTCQTNRSVADVSALLMDQPHNIRRIRLRGPRRSIDPSRDLDSTERVRATPAGGA